MSKNKIPEGAIPVKAASPFKIISWASAGFLGGVMVAANSSVGEGESLKMVFPIKVLVAGLFSALVAVGTLVEIGDPIGYIIPNSDIQPSGEAADHNSD